MYLSECAGKTHLLQQLQLVILWILLLLLFLVQLSFQKPATCPWATPCERFRAIPVKKIFEQYFDMIDAVLYAQRAPSLATRSHTQLLELKQTPNPIRSMAHVQLIDRNITWHRYSTYHASPTSSNSTIDDESLMPRSASVKLVPSCHSFRLM